MWGKTSVLLRLKAFNFLLNYQIKPYLILLKQVYSKWVGYTKTGPLNILNTTGIYAHVDKPYGAFTTTIIYIQPFPSELSDNNTAKERGISCKINVHAAFRLAVGSKSL